MVQCSTRVVLGDPVVLVHLVLVMAILTQLIIVAAMMKLAALLIIVMAVVLGIPARNVQPAVALKVMAAGIVILIPVQVVLVQLPVLRVAGQRVRAMQIVP